MQVQGRERGLVLVLAQALAQAQGQERVLQELEVEMDVLAKLPQQAVQQRHLQILQFQQAQAVHQ